MKSTTNLASLIGINNIRYEQLLGMTQERYGNIDKHINTINLYIDIYSIIKPVLLVDEVDIIDYTAVTSGIINICAHYRRFYRTRFNCDTNIYLVNSLNCDSNSRKIIPYYNTTVYSVLTSPRKQKIVELLETSMNLIRILTPYLNNIYMIDTNFETGVIIYDLMCKTDLNNNFAHIILSNDAYLYQLVGMKPYTDILKRKGFKHEPQYISNFNVLNKYLKERKCVSNQNTIISPQFLSLLFAMAGIKQRNIKSIKNISMSIRIIENGLKNMLIRNKRIASLEEVHKFLLASNISAQDANEILKRYKVVDIITQHTTFMTSAENYSDRLVNLEDPITVKNINNVYFENYPIDLNNL